MATKRTKDPPPQPPKPKPRSRYEATIDAAARAEILSAMREAEGRKTEAAQHLGIPIRTLYREIDRLDMWAELDRLAAEHAWKAWKGFERT